MTENNNIYTLGFNKSLNRVVVSDTSLEDQDPAGYSGVFSDPAQGIGFGGLVAGSQNSIYVMDPAKGMWLGNAKFADAPFSVDMEGRLKATLANISGTITASTGSIGGFTINSDNIQDAANSMGLASTVTGGDDVRFWAGGTFANRATAPFRVTEAGAVTGSSVTITGGSVATSTLSGLVGLSNENIAAQGWTQTSAFTVTDADTIAWGAGTFTTAAGTAYSITGSNTGNMAAKTFIYLDIGVSTTAYQTTTTATTAIGSGKVLLAIAQNGTTEATFMLLNNNSYNIDAANIVAASITSNEIAANTITGNNILTMNIAGKNAIFDTGTVGGWNMAASALVGPSGANIRVGQTTFDTGTGFFIGNVAGTAQFSIGVSTGSKVTWDGTTLLVVGTQNISKVMTASEALSIGDAVRMSTGTTNHLSENGDEGSDREFGNNAGGAQYEEQAAIFTIPTGGHIVSKVSLKVKRTAADTNGVYMTIQTDAAGVPSGTIKGTTATIPGATFTSSYVSYDFTFPADVNLAAGSYWAVVTRVTPSSGTVYNIAGNSTGGSVNHARRKNGAGWLADYTDDWDITVVGGDGTSGNVKKASALTTFASDIFIGFAGEAISAAASGPIIISGTVTTSGLTGSKPYYLSNTAGAISLTVGTVTRKVGLSFSSTQLLITNIW